MILDVKYNLMEKVTLIDIELPALIEEISIGINGLSYRCAYWNNGERYSVWVNACELKERDK